MKILLCVALVLCVWRQVALADEPRMLSPEESGQLITALVKQPEQPLSEDPSCRSDLSVAGKMSVAEGLGVQIQRAVSEDAPLRISTYCIARAGYPKEPHQEYCVLNFSDPQTKDLEYGLVFLMDWQQKSIVPGSAECF